ncbi:BsuPI-related putative proteinase inhibitor [Neobacillus sp. D3-1R]|uniref:BsuPI-related putative proteinase inhibitor n=1 Tax=Neobacillus sp. D3-1R TaxID=3445778 RepID=UPI003FA12EEB
MKKWFVLLSAMALLIPTSASASAEGNISKNEQIQLFRATQDVSLQERYEFLVEKGILKGKADGKANFDKSLTRAELAVSLYRMYHLKDEKESTPLKDIKKHWAQKEIQAIYKKGWMVGEKGYKFNPNKKMTIEQVAHVLTKVTKLDKDAYMSIELNASNWAKPYLAAALAEGFLTSEENYRETALRSHLVYSLYEVYHFMNKDRGIVAGTLEPKVTISNTKDQDYKWTYTVKNQTEKEQTLNISGSKFDYILKKDGKKIEQYSEGKNFIMIYVEKTLKQGEELTFEGDLKGLEKGKYELEIWLIDKNWPDAKTKMEFEVK